MSVDLVEFLEINTTVLWKIPFMKQYSVGLSWREMTCGVTDRVAGEDGMLIESVENARTRPMVMWNVPIYDCLTGSEDRPAAKPAGLGRVSATITPRGGESGAGYPGTRRRSASLRGRLPPEPIRDGLTDRKGRPGSRLMSELPREYRRGGRWRDSLVF